MTHPTHHLPDEVKEKIRWHWGLGVPDITTAAVVAVLQVRKVFRQHQVPWDDERQALIGVAAGRLAEQARGKGSEAFIRSFERVCMSNICETAVYNSIE